MQQLPQVAQDFWKEVNKDKLVIFADRSYALVEYNKNFYEDHSKVNYYIGSTKRFPKGKNM